jgi:hypothetical protein
MNISEDCSPNNPDASFGRGNLQLSATSVEVRPMRAEQERAYQAPSFSRAIFGFVGSFVFTTVVLVVLAI